MKGKKVIAIVPARMASSRFPGKPLTMIHGLAMVEHVRRRALLANGIDEVVVATCDKVIADTVISAGGEAVMTSDKHERSTERVAEAMQSLTGDVVVVVQGDEPLLLPHTVERVANPLVERDDVQCAAFLSNIKHESDYDNPNIVKAACDQRDFVFFLSRARIPYVRRPGSLPIYRETGIRAFKSTFLPVYAQLRETPLEKAEEVDMLRILEHRYSILGVLGDEETIGVDHKEDIEGIECSLKTDPVQIALHKAITGGSA